MEQNNLIKEPLKKRGHLFTEQRIEKREQLFNKIEKKIMLVNELRDFVIKRRNLSYDELGGEFERKKQEMINSEELDFITEDFNDKLALFEDKRSKFFELSLEMSGLNYNISEGKLDKDDNDYQEKNKELLALQLELKKSKADNDLMFNFELENFFSSLLEKRKNIIQMQKLYEEDKEKFFNKIISLKDGLDEIDRNDFNIDFDGGYDLSIELKNEDFDKIKGYENSNAFNTGLIGIGENLRAIFIRDKKGKEDTLKHERNHTLSDSFTDNEIRYSLFISGLKYRIESLKELKEGKDLGVSEEELEKCIKGSIEEYPEKAYSELIADIDRIPTSKLTTFISVFLAIGNNADSIVEDIGDEEIKNIVRESFIKSFYKFESFIEKLSDIFFVCGQMGETEMAQGAFILNSPKDIRVIERFFKNRYGDKYEIYKQLKPLFSDKSDFDSFDQYKIFEKNHVKYQLLIEKKRFGLGSLEMGYRLADRNRFENFFFNNISELYDFLGDKENIELVSEEKELLVEKFFAVTMDINLLATGGAGKVFESSQKLEKIGEVLGIEKFKDIAKILRAMYFENQLDEAILLNNFNDLDLVIVVFGKEEVSFLINNIVLSGNIFDKYKTHKGEDYDIESIKNTKFWEYLENNNIELKV